MHAKTNTPTSQQTRRRLLRGMLVTSGMALSGCGAGSSTTTRPGKPVVAKTVQNMPYRKFGRTDMIVSEVGFGAWGIGGQAYGSADQQESLRALALAEELGCNFVDTAQVYGTSEATIGQFLRGRRDKWIVATKYSGQPAGMTATLESQLKTLGIERVDLYQIHWVPKDPSQPLYEELYRLREVGKVRYVGVSLSSPADIDYVVDHTHIDSVQLPFSLLDPLPFLARVDRLRKSGLAVIARSSLKEGFLTGKFTSGTVFSDPNDQRSKWSRGRVKETIDQVERLRFLEKEHGSMVAAAIRYPLSFPEISTVILGTMNTLQARSNFGEIPGGRFSAESLSRVAAIQDELGLWGFRERLLRHWRGLFAGD